MDDPAGGAQPGLSRFSDGAGVQGALLAALCYAGAPVVVSAFTAVGFGFLRNDAILSPLVLARSVSRCGGRGQKALIA